MTTECLSKVSLGTASFGNIYGILNQNKVTSFKELYKIVDLFVNNGGFQIDTSNCYGDSEKILGNILRDYKKHNLKITSKFKVTKRSKIEDIRLQIDKSYQIFGEKLDSVLCHTPDIISSDLKNIVLEAFEYIDNRYNFKKGLSIYSKSEVFNLDNKFRNHINEIQAPLNIFDDTADLLKKEKLIDLQNKVTARSIYLQGFLISEKCILSRFKEQHLLFQKYCLKKKLPNKEICIRYVLQKKYIDSFTIGINKLNHLIELIEILKKIKKDNKKTTINSLSKDNLDNYLIDPRKWDL